MPQAEYDVKPPRSNATISRSSGPRRRRACDAALIPAASAPMTTIRSRTVAPPASGKPGSLRGVELAALNVLDPKALIETFGTLGVLAIVFAETGLLVGFFLPGDSLLFMAGFFASSAALATADFQLSLPVLLVGLPI